MHDTLEYFETDPLYRKYRHGLLTFRPLYMEHEQFVLPLSHDEVVHLKKSLIAKTQPPLETPPYYYERLFSRLLYAFLP